jgi:hypothetical protein
MKCDGDGIYIEVNVFQHYFFNIEINVTNENQLLLTLHREENKERVDGENQ